MSMKIDFLMGTYPGHTHIDLDVPHEPEMAQAFLGAIQHKRHTYIGEGNFSNLTEFPNLTIFSNNTGLIAFNSQLPLEIALQHKKAILASKAFEKLLACSYNDQCLYDAFSYYESGELIRRIYQADEIAEKEVINIGALLPEEIELLESYDSELECGYGDVHEFEHDGIVYRYEGFVPVTGVGLDLTSRFLKPNMTQI